MNRMTALIASTALACAMSYAADRQHETHSDRLHAVLSLSLANLEPLPADPSNRWADDTAAAAFGYRLFFETRLSATGLVSCASCHDPHRDFQDALPLGKGVGTTDRRTMPLAATAYSPFLFWDGRKDSQWAQALGPLESAVEHGGSRAQFAHLIAADYRGDYEQVFGPLPDLRGIPASAGPIDDPAARAAWERMTPQQRDAVTHVFVNIGKAIAAYERQIRFEPARFDRFVMEWQRTGALPQTILDARELAGLWLFVGKANCTQCHNGPLLTNQEFHNTGVPARPGLPADRGRFAAIAAVLSDEFNCRGRWSDARQDDCPDLEFLAPASRQQERAFKVPSLRNVANRAPYMHAGQFATLRAVLNHYNRAPRAPSGHSELEPLHLSDTELDQIEAFLRALSSEPAAAPAAATIMDANPASSGARP